jgi:hypothetical protein
MHILLADVVANTGAHTGPMDVLEQAVVALVGCIEILADAVDVLQERVEAPGRPELALSSEVSAESVDVRLELADLTRQVEGLSKTVKKLSSKSLSSKNPNGKNVSSKNVGKRKK